MNSSQNVSPIVPIEGDRRLTIFPIGRQSIWDIYNTMKSLIWLPTDVDYSKDKNDHDRVSVEIRNLIELIMALYACLDKLVNINLIERFKSEFGIMEIDVVYDLQAFMENVHSESYSIQLETIVTDALRKAELISAISDIDEIKDICDYAKDLAISDAVIGERLLIAASIEGLIFISAFCPLFWVQNKGYYGGIGQANEYTARDETMHAYFSLKLYTMIRPELQVSDDRVRQIFEKAIDLANAFMRAAIPVPMAGMNASLMGEYHEYQADTLLSMVDMAPLFGTKNPFMFMNNLSIPNRTSFFDRRVTDYSRETAQVKREYTVADSF